MEIKSYKEKFTFIRRRTTNVVMLSVSFLAAIITIAPLILIFYYTISKGIANLNINFFTKLPT
ncbi:MAG: phosphate ABC transporter permease PstA, partial [Ignavibacteriaceae bacterium]